MYFFFFLPNTLIINFDLSLSSSCTNAWGTDNKISLSRKKIYIFQVGYPTALDVFIIICFVTVFAALVEFAILNFFDTLVRRIKKKDKERKTILTFMQQLNPDARMKTMTRRPQSAQSQNEQNDGLGGDGIGEDLDENLLTPDEEESFTVIPRKAIFCFFRSFLRKIRLEISIKTSF